MFTGRTAGLTSLIVPAADALDPGFFQPDAPGRDAHTRQEKPGNQKHERWMSKELFNHLLYLQPTDRLFG